MPVYIKPRDRYVGARGEAGIHSASSCQKLKVGVVSRGIRPRAPKRSGALCRCCVQLWSKVYATFIRAQGEQTWSTGRLVSSVQLTSLDFWRSLTRRSDSPSSARRLLILVLLSWMRSICSSLTLHTAKSGHERSRL